MNILEITEFSAGVCGVWSRVLAESKEFRKLGHNVIVFSSNIEKGTNKKDKTVNIFRESEVTPEGIIIYRFPNKKSKLGLIKNMLSKNVNNFDFEPKFKQLIEQNKIDCIITHLIHPHSFKVLKLCKKYRIKLMYQDTVHSYLNPVPCYLVTHAPFNVKRKFPLNIATSLYYKFKVKPKLKLFTKIIRITEWEKEYLNKLGISDDKTVYIPNGIADEFFTQPRMPEIKRDVLFLGRIEPLKDLKTFILTAKALPSLTFSIVGPASNKKYKQQLNKLIIYNNITNVKFYPSLSLTSASDIRKKIAIIDQHQFLVLPSLREAMPQVLIEAMARGKIVISSTTDGGKEIINNASGGFLFSIGNIYELAKLIQDQKYNSIIYKNDNIKIQQQARTDAKKYAWRFLIKKYEKVLILGKNTNIK